MPFARGQTRRAWRRRVAAELVDRLDTGGDLFLVGSGPEDRREMLRVAALLPDDVVAELYEDPWYPGYTFMEVRLLPAPVAHHRRQGSGTSRDHRRRAV